MSIPRGPEYVFGPEGASCHAADVRAMLDTGARVELALGAPGWVAVTGLADAAEPHRVRVLTTAGNYICGIRNIRVRVTEPEQEALAS